MPDAGLPKPKSITITVDRRTHKRWSDIKERIATARGVANMTWYDILEEGLAQLDPAPPAPRPSAEGDRSAPASRPTDPVTA
jgi:hypothetical protein